MIFTRSSTEIANAAFAKFTDISIKDIEDVKDVNARMANIAYKQCLPSLLERNEWSFALEYAKLNRIDPDPLFEYKYRYNAPSMFIKLCDQTLKFCNLIKMGSGFVSNASEVYIIYTKYIVDPNMFTPLFTESLTWFIAANLVCPLKVSPQMNQLFTSNAMMICREAIAKDSENSYQVMQLFSDQIRQRLTSTNLFSYDQDVHRNKESEPCL